MLTHNTPLVYDHDGPYIAVGYYGQNKEDTEQVLNLLFNIGCSKSEPIMLSDTFGYLTGPPETMKRGVSMALVPSVHRQALLDSASDIRTLVEDCIEKGRSQWESMKIESFLRRDVFAPVYSMIPQIENL